MLPRCPLGRGPGPYLADLVAGAAVPPTRHGSPLEISVVYLRSDWDETQYESAQGPAAMLQLERSRAIKCPSVLEHLANAKMVQQELTVPGVLERFLPDKDTADKISDTFMPTHRLDESETGRSMRELVQQKSFAGRHVLKPPGDGGGHNVYGEDITGFLEGVAKEEWRQYILMEKMTPPKLNNVLMLPQGFHHGEVISELGVVGACMWDYRPQKDAEPGKGSCTLLMNEVACFTFKTKPSNVDEMSVVKGYGCFDSPCLIEINHDT